MNCKPGDLAVVVNDLDVSLNNGALVQVLHRADPASYDGVVDWECAAVSTIVCHDGWVAHPGEGGFGYRDCELRPIRDSDGEDEMLRIAGKPEGVPA